MKNKISSEIEVATIEKIHHYFAFAKLDESKRIGVIHISNLTEEFISPPLNQHLEIGQRFLVKILNYNKKYDCLELSRKAYLRLEKSIASGIEIGNSYICEIEKSTEIGALLSYNTAKLYLPSTSTPWSNYKVLRESGKINEGKKIEVYANRWDSEKNIFIANLPKPNANHIKNEAIESEVILIRSNYIKKQKLQSVIYTLIENQWVLRITTSELRNPEEIFSIGSKIPVLIKKINVYTGMFEGEIFWQGTKISYKKMPTIGQIISATVVRVAPYGALCLLDDRVIGFMHKSSIATNTIERLENHIYPGDIIEAKVTEINCHAGSDCNVDFIRRISKNTIKTKQNQDNFVLIDLSIERKSAARGGFTRDASFRGNVLEAFSYKCCICGFTFNIGQSSAMEAAHIIPKSKRGADILQNSLCLCPVHHWAFDRGYITIDPDGYIKVATTVKDLGEHTQWLSKLANTKAHLNNTVETSLSALSWHEKNIFLDEDFN